VLAVVVDIDDTLVDTNRRRWAAWRHVLGRELPLKVVEEHESRDILRTYASSKNAVWERFWRVLLCWEEEGVELLNLDTPIPYAADVVRRWNEDHRVVYFTGRSVNMHDLTLEKLAKFGFPIEEVDLVMLSLDDWHLYLNSKASALELRSKLFASVHAKYRIVRVLDDIPRFFSIYKKFEVPERIAIQRSKVYSRQEYFSQGATKVVNKWKQLL
jgi:hypothetical protein